MVAFTDSVIRVNEAFGWSVSRVLQLENLQEQILKDFKAANEDSPTPLTDKELKDRAEGQYLMALADIMDPTQNYFNSRNDFYSAVLGEAAQGQMITGMEYLATPYFLQKGREDEKQKYLDLGFNLRYISRAKNLKDENIVFAVEKNKNAAGEIIDNADLLGFWKEGRGILRINEDEKTVKENTVALSDKQLTALGLTKDSVRGEYQAGDKTASYGYLSGQAEDRDFDEALKNGQVTQMVSLLAPEEVEQLSKDGTYQVRGAFGSGCQFVIFQTNDKIPSLAHETVLPILLNTRKTPAKIRGIVINHRDYILP